MGNVLVGTAQSIDQINRRLRYMRWRRNIECSIHQLRGFTIAEYQGQVLLPISVLEEDPCADLDLALEKYNVVLPKNVPPYLSDTKIALRLFSDIKNIRLIFDQIFSPAEGTLDQDDVDQLGEWYVGYEYKGIQYRPGAGSYYPLAEALCRAWLYYKEFYIFNFDWERKVVENEIW